VYFVGLRIETEGNPICSLGILKRANTLLRSPELLKINAAQRVELGRPLCALQRLVPSAEERRQVIGVSLHGPSVEV
jgi:hypothetical protein